MAVTITSCPTSVITGNSVTIAFTSDGGARSAYEIMYKLKTDTSWSTLGKVTNYSTTGITVDAKEVGNKVVDFVEVYIRILVYYSDSGNVGKSDIVKNHIEYSSPKSIIFKPSSTGSLNIKRSSDILRLPSFTSIKNTGLQCLNIRRTSSQTVKIPLVDTTHPCATNVKVRVNSSTTKALIKSDATPSFSDSGIKGYGSKIITPMYCATYTQFPAYIQYNYGTVKPTTYLVSTDYYYLEKAYYPLRLFYDSRYYGGGVYGNFYSYIGAYANGNPVYVQGYIYFNGYNAYYYFNAYSKITQKYYTAYTYYYFAGVGAQYAGYYYKYPMSTVTYGATSTSQYYFT